MKKLYLLITVLSISFFLFAAEPTAPGTELTTRFIEGNSIEFTFKKGNGSGRLAILKKGSPVTARPQNGNSYLANGTFGSGQEIVPGEFVVYNGTGVSFSIYNLVPDTEYFIAFFEVNGSGLNAEYLTSSFLSGSANTLAKPTLQPTNFSSSSITGNNMTISWQAGDGVNRIVLARRGGPVNANPVELTRYSENSRVEYSSATKIGDNNIVVYKGTGNSINLSEMYPDTTYHFAIFEYNGNNGPVYLTTNPLRGSAKTLPGPTIASSNISFSTIEANRFVFQCRAGNGTRRIVVMREGAPIEVFPQKNMDYGSNAYFDEAPEIAPGHKVVYDDISSSFFIYNLAIGTTYYIAIFEYSGAGSNRAYLTTEYAAISQSTLTIPSINVTNIDTIAVASNNAQLKFTPGNGSGRLVVVKKDAPVDFVPNNFTTYNVQTTYGATLGDLGNGNYGVSKGANSTATINLQPNTTYHVAAFEYNGTNYPVYNTTNVDTYSFTTKLPPPPTSSSIKITFSEIEGNSLRVLWTKGNGERRIVIVRKNSYVSAVPENGVQYTDANKAFNLAPEIEPGQKVIYDGNGNFADIDSLEIGSFYFVQIVEYNGTGNITSYLTSNVLSGTTETLSAPTVSASRIDFKLLTLEILRIGWKRGSGSKCIVLARKNAPVDGVPENLKTYDVSRDFGVGSKIGDSYVVSGSNLYRAIEDTTIAEIYRMEPGNTYYFKIFEYNGVTRPVYKQTDPAEGSFTITFEPPSASTNFRTTGSDGNSLSLQWVQGGGSKRIIVVREGQDVDVIPLDGVDYVEAKDESKYDFGLAAEIEPGQRVVYDGSSTTMVLKGLNPNKQYFFRIFEYGGTGADIDYLTSEFASLIASTKSAPTIQASNIVVSGITPESGNVSWTNGNGENRLLVAKKGSPVTNDPKDTTMYNTYYFGSGGTQLGDGNFVLYKGSSDNFAITRLESGTTYHLGVYEMNGFNGPVLMRPPATGLFTTLGPPKENAIIGTTTEITSNSFHINLTAGSGQKRLILVKEAIPVNAEPVDNRKYVENTFLGAGNELGVGNFVVYDGDDNNVVITGLKAGTNYYFSVFEYNAFNGGTIINYLRPSTATGMITTLGALPVGWLAFTGTILQNVAKLKFTTGFEQNNHHFIVERSVDGIDFKQVGKLLGKGNSATGHTYSFDDLVAENILRNASQLIYRIRQVDLDDRSTLSATIKLKLPKQNTITVYPNPVTKGSLPGVFLGGYQKGKLQLYSAQGQLLMEQQLINGYNQVNMKNKIAGWCMLKVLLADGTIKTYKVLIE